MRIGSNFMGSNWCPRKRAKEEVGSCAKKATSKMIICSDFYKVYLDQTSNAYIFEYQCNQDACNLDFESMPKVIMNPSRF